MKRRTFLCLPATLYAQARRYPSPEEVADRLHGWGRSHPRLITVTEAGRSVEGRPVWAARLTDSRTPGEGKEHIIISALHTGLERSSTPSVLTIMRWLLSGEAEAAEVLRRQVVTCLPMMNPDGYIRGAHANANHLDIYTGWTVQGPQNPEKMPEAVAFQKLLDEEQPEIHADIHGHSMEIEGYAHVESSGRAYSNPTLRPYRMAVARLMDEAAAEAGFGSDLLEEDAERVFGGTQEMGMEPNRFWLGVRTGGGKSASGVTRVYAAVYAYNRFHTMTLASECAWEQSALARHRRLLRIGNERWPGEFYAGYPARVILKNGFHQICAYGTSAAERRRSRVELWQRQSAIATAVNNPQVEGKTMFVCATSPAAARWMEGKSLRELSARLHERSSIEAKPVRRFLKGFPVGPGQWGPEAMLLSEHATSGADGRPAHGLAMRLRVPYPRAAIEEVLLNGRPAGKSETDGYVAWSARGFTTVQFNIPPQTSREQDLFIATLRYSPGESRTQSSAWR